jgi:urease accessory protein
MLRLHGVVGLASDPGLRDRLHTLEHEGAMERLVIEEADLGRRRLRLTTDRGTDCAVSLDRDTELVDGTVLLLEEARAIVLRVGAPRQWRLRAQHAAAALQLGWHAGNLHWRVRFEGDELVVMLDGPLADYRARIAALLEAGLVEERGGD